MSDWIRAAGVVGSLLAVHPLPLHAQATGASEPQSVDLQERTERHLVQVDVSLLGPKHILDSLTPGEFDLKVMTRVVDDFTVDRICREAPAVDLATQPDTDNPIRSTVVPTRVAPTSYLFYFDHTSMTLEGNNRAPLIARELIPLLVRDGNRGMVVSNGRAVTTHADLTSDVDVLIAGIDAMTANFTTWWEPTQRNEDSAINELTAALGSTSKDHAARLAKQFAVEEQWFTEKSFRRLAMVLGRLADLPQPKAAVIFTDRLRQQPGKHYLSYFTASESVPLADNPALAILGSMGDLAALTFDRVVNEANAHGVRLYTVQAQGLTTIGAGVAQQRADDPSSVRVTAGTRHITDAQNTLRTLAAETGGEAFLHGLRAAKMADTITGDFDCVWLVSFDAADFPRNQPIPVAIDVRHPAVTVRHRGQVFIQSEDRRLTSRLLAAFTAPDAMKDDGTVHGAVIPTGFENGAYTALVQMFVSGSPLADATWDLGLSVVSRESVRDETARRVNVAAPGTPIVLELVTSFAPGPFEIVLVAHEPATDRVATARIEGEWPELSDDEAGVGPIAVLQQASAVFLRGDETKAHGTLGQPPDSPLRTDLASAIVSLVCWHRAINGNIVVERNLVGESTVGFPPLTIDTSDATCAPLMDRIPAGALGDGGFTYDMRVTQNGRPIGAAERSFAAIRTHLWSDER